MKAIKAENHKTFVRITNMVDPDLTASESGYSPGGGGGGGGGGGL